MGRIWGVLPLASPRRSNSERAAGTAVKNTARPLNTPTAATTPKSASPEMSPNRLVRKLTMVVTPAKPSGSITPATDWEIPSVVPAPPARTSR